MNRVYSSLLFILFLTIWLEGRAQNDSLISTIKSQAEISIQAVVNKDYETLMEYSHPNVIQYVGGKEAMIEAFEELYASFDRRGWSIESVELKDSIVVEKQKLGYHALIPKTLTAKYNTKIIIHEGYLIGFSDDKRDKWAFIEANKYGSESFFEMFPDFETTLTIPERRPPIILENELDSLELELIEELKKRIKELDQFIVGKWKGPDANDLGQITFDENGNVEFMIAGQVYGGKDFEIDGQNGSARYEVNTELEPIEIDLIVTNLGTYEEFRLLGILEVMDENSIFLTIGLDGVRPTQITGENSVFLTRMVGQLD